MTKVVNENLSENIIIPSKAERQKAFIAACRKEGLSSREIVKRASIFPSGKKSRVLHWPKL